MQALAEHPAATSSRDDACIAVEFADGKSRNS